MRGGKKEAKSVKGGDEDLFKDERGDVKKVRGSERVWLMKMNEERKESSSPQRKNDEDHAAGSG